MLYLKSESKRRVIQGKLTILFLVPQTMANRIEETALFNNLSKWEISFIESVRLFLKNAQPGLFSFRYFDYYIGIKTKGDSGFPFLFKKPKDVLIFKCFGSSKKTSNDYEIKESNDKNLSFVVSSILNSQPKQASDTAKGTKEASTSSSKLDLKFFDRLSEWEKNFLERFMKQTRAKYPKTVRFRDRKTTLKVVTYKGSKDIFSFKIVNSALTLQSKLDGNEITLALTKLDKVDFDNLLNITANLIKRDKPGLPQAPIKEEQIEKKVSFSETLTNEEKAFVLSFIKIIKEQFESSFDPCTGESFISFKEKSTGRALFWFLRKGGELCFEAHPKNRDVASCHIKNKDKDTLIDILGMVKKTCDSYALISKREKEKEINRKKEEQPVNPKAIIKAKPIDERRTDRIFSFIRDEFRNQAYNALPSFRALCRSIKTYFLDVVNKDRKIKFTNAREACESALFYKNSISWTDKAWLNSARIIYSYFKANTLIEKIQYYEEIKQVKMCDNYDALLDYFYYCISNNTQIDYSKAPSVTKDFALIPIESLNEILENFKSYELE